MVERCQVSGFSVQVSAQPLAASVQSERRKNCEKANPPKADKYRISNKE